MDIPLPEESQPPGLLEELPPPPPPPPGPPPALLTPCDNIPLPACAQQFPPGFLPPFPPPARPILAPILPAEAPPLPLLPPPALAPLESSLDPADDPNRYSPTRATAEDDFPPTPPPPPPPKSEPPTVGARSQTTGTKTTVLGKAQAKKRLLAFSMTKQGGGAGLSFGFAKKLAPKVNAGSAKAFSGVAGEEEAAQEGKDSSGPKEKVPAPTKKKSNKKGQSREDRARAVVSAIEEIKREELMLRGAIAYGTVGTGDMTLPIPLLGQPLNLPIKPKPEYDVAGNRLLEQQKGAIESLLDTILSQSDKTSSNDKAASELDADGGKGEKKDDKKRDRKDSDRRSSRRKSSRERHRSRDRHGRSSSGKERHKEEKKSSKLELPTSWSDFHAGGFKIDEFRRIKLKLEARELSSTNSSRSRDRHRNRRRSPRDRRSRVLELFALGNLLDLHCCVQDLHFIKAGSAQTHIRALTSSLNL